MKDYYYDQEVDFNEVDIRIEKVKGIGITHLEDNYGYSYFKGSDIANLLKVHNDVPKSFTIGKVIEADKLFDIEGVLKYDEKTDSATKYSPYWLTLEALDNAFKNSKYYTEYICETLNLLNNIVSCDNSYTFIYQDKNELTVKDELEVNDKFGVVISSRLIAQQMGKRHDNILQRIDELIRDISENYDFSSLVIPSVYKVSGQHKQYKEYLLTKKSFTLFMFNVQGYNDFKIDYIDKFEQMENHMQELVQIETEKRVKELEKENHRYKTMLKTNIAIDMLEDYQEDIVSYTATEVADEIDEDVIEMNKWLSSIGVQDKVGTVWMLNNKYAANGFTVLGVYRDQFGEERTYTRWTEKGKKFIHNLYRQTRLEIA